ncbi:MAG: ABC transporter permease, partial [Blastocatellia bacterium]
MRAINFLDTLVRDLRFGIRMLFRKPAFTAIILVTLMVGIGASVAIFSVVDAALFRPLPFRNPDRLTALWESNYKQLNWSKMFVSYRDFQEWQRNNHGFDSMAAYTWAVRSKSLTGWGEPQDVTVTPASSDFFSVLGVKPELGRTFEPSDASNPSVLVLSHRGWMKLFAGSPDIVGKTVGLDRQSYTVIGVMPQNFEMYPKETQAWSLLTSAS